eukprot:CAMPEP_0172194282 /NCGR_PEP_ID=MMETSP1050-20130122/25483_1 /TAXON_ID=233186 /ORGANISM="Cryptomonas curvata, Strain CCAP979/52" /LENGTH=112 /DNA_ID=CAMNT_0012870051 /DNA_START=346 /DNA_END=681 /DNA_ORIENTATION=-
MEIDVEFSGIRSGQPSSNIHMKMFLSYSKGAEGEANHKLLDQPLSSHSYRHRMQLQLMTFNQFLVRVVVTDQFTNQTAEGRVAIITRELERGDVVTADEELGERLLRVPPDD